MPAMTDLMTSMIRWVRRQKALDPAVEKTAAWVHAATSSAPVKNALSGTWLGHPLHPALTDLPVGVWSAAAVLDLTGSNAAAARRLVGVGLGASAVAAASGFADWSDMHGPDKRVGLVHGILNAAASGLQAGSWLARRRGHRVCGTVLTLTGLGITLAAAYVGGHLSFVKGIGVRTTAFERSPREWTDAGADIEIGEGALHRVDVDGVPVLLTRHDGHVRALSNTCSHAGGPLDEGTFDDGCVTCPWHGSRFLVDDGSVMHGPASIPQRIWEVRIDGGRVLVRASSAG